MSPSHARKGTTYSVAIIGAGTIGTSWDNPDSSRILTHAHAFSANERTHLVGIVDTDVARATREASTWGTSPYTDVATLFSKESPDIVVIATPDETHATVLETVLASSARLVICEKPLAANEPDAERIRKMLSMATAPVIVYFPRRFDTRTLRLREELTSGTLGNVVSVRATYAKGTHHIGSHLFDLLRLLFGEMTGAAAHFKIDDRPDDPTYGGVAAFENCREVYLQAFDGRASSELELDIFTDTKRIRLTDRGYTLETQEIVADPVFAGFRMFGPATRKATDLENALPTLVRHAVAVVDGSELPLSDAESALKTFDACQRFASTYKPIYYQPNGEARD